MPENQTEIIEEVTTTATRLPNWKMIVAALVILYALYTMTQEDAG